MTGRRRPPRVARSLVRSGSRPGAMLSRSEVTWSAAKCSAAPVWWRRYAVSCSLRRTPPAGATQTRGPREPKPPGSSLSSACRLPVTSGRRRLARRSRRRGDRHGRAGRGYGRSTGSTGSTDGTGTGCTLRTRHGRCPGRSPRRHGVHRSHRGRSTCGVIAGVLWSTRTSVFATGTTELGSGMTVRVHVAVGVRVGATLCPSG